MEVGIVKTILVKAFTLLKVGWKNELLKKSVLIGNKKNVGGIGAMPSSKRSR